MTSREIGEIVMGEVRIVMVEPSHPGNIGGAARAMKNMGLSSLTLVNPLRFPDPQADWRAAHARDILDNASVVGNLSSAIADCGLVIGTSARSRRVPWPTVDAEELGYRLSAGDSTDPPVAIVFGREANGLTNDELMQCSLHLVIPSNPDYSSLNLAMAIQVVAYELHKQSGRTVEKAPNWDRDLARIDEVEAFYEHLERTLIQIDFYDPRTPRAAMRRLRRLFNRVNMDETEVGMLRGILTAMGKKIGNQA